MPRVREEGQRGSGERLEFDDAVAGVFEASEEGGVGEAEQVGGEGEGC